MMDDLIVWGGTQEEHDDTLRELYFCRSSDPTLKFYDAGRATKVSADASQSGISAVLLQQHDGDWCPVAFGSRAMTPAKTRNK
jgi:hypothetical protein